MSSLPYAFVTTSQGMRGFFAVLMTFDKDCGHHTPWNTGVGSYSTREQAQIEAKQWAQAEDIPFIP